MLLTTATALLPAYIAPRRLGHYYTSSADAKEKACTDILSGRLAYGAAILIRNATGMLRY